MVDRDPQTLRHTLAVAWHQARRDFSVDELRTASPPSPRLIGQERALAAVDLGLRMRAHVFLLGPVGTGKTTYALARAQALAESSPAPPDWCYVPGPDRGDARLVALPTGSGRTFRDDIQAFLASARSHVRQALDSDSYQHRRQALLHQYEDAQTRAWEEALALARAQGFTVEPTPSGPVLTVPLKADAQPYRPEEFLALPEAERRAFEDRQRILEEPLAKVLRKMRAAKRDEMAALAHDTATVVEAALRWLAEPLRERYEESPGVIQYIDDMVRDLARHRDELLPPDDHGDLPEDAGLSRYSVQVVIEHGREAGAPVVLELNPTYANLFGRIGYAGSPTEGTGHLVIHAGSLHRASGGFLVLSAEELVREPFAYQALKRALRLGEVRLEGPAPGGWAPAVPIEPIAMPLQVTVLLVGSAELYQFLYLQDPEFRRLFTIQADFAPDMPASLDNLRALTGVLEAASEDLGLPLRSSAAQALIAHGARMAEARDRITTRLGELFAVLREGAAVARERGDGAIGEEHVKEALRQRRQRAAGPAEAFDRGLKRGTLLIDTAGHVTGQVNGLAVFATGDAVFGRPSRITAVTYPGRDGVVAIERETFQSGTSHTKGVLILAAFLAGRFGPRCPLSLGASLTFEQLYSGVDGDSASSAELFALLSALADLPIDQGIAVTGSVNQKGEIQPIGGVNEKIEGFFHVCEATGLTGEQGVIIPRRNLSHLMLDDDVVEALKGERFHLWAIDHVDEGITLLTGVAAGTADGASDTVMGRVQARLLDYAERWKAAGRS
jgi:predicted ATP-dependent protease